MTARHVYGATSARHVHKLYSLVNMYVGECLSYTPCCFDPVGLVGLGSKPNTETLNPYSDPRYPRKLRGTGVGHVMLKAGIRTVLGWISGFRV